MIKVPECYKPIYTTDKPIILLTGGRGSAKSFNIATFTKRLTYEKDHIILYTRYTLDSAEKSIIPEFVQKIDLEGDSDYFRINKSDITNTYTGSKILFTGIKTSSGNQTAKLKSIQGLSTFVVDEAEEWVNEDEYDTISLSIRSTKAKNRVIIIMNPSNKTHWVYEKFIKGTSKFIEVEGVQIPISEHPDVLHIHTTYHDNILNLSNKFINEVGDIKKTDLEKYNHKVLGTWRNASEGQIFKRWKSGKFDDSLPYCYGLDFGYNHPNALVKVAIDENSKKIYAKQIVYGSGMTPTQLYRQIQHNIKPNQLIIADPAGIDKINELREMDFNCIPAKKPAGSVIKGLNEMLDYLIIFDQSPDLEHEAENYIWLEEKEIPRKEYDDGMDAMRYAFTFIKGL